MTNPTHVYVLNATTDSDVLLPVNSTSETAEGAVFVQVKWGNGTFEWLKPSEYRPVTDNLYRAGFKGRTVDLWAANLYAAKQAAVAEFTPSKRDAGLVWVELVMLGGAAAPVEKTADF